MAKLMKMIFVAMCLLALSAVSLADLKKEDQAAQKSIDDLRKVFNKRCGQDLQVNSKHAEENFLKMLWTETQTETPTETKGFLTKKPIPPEQLVKMAADKCRLVIFTLTLMAVGNKEKLCKLTTLNCSFKAIANGSPFEVEKKVPCSMS